MRRWWRHSPCNLPLLQSNFLQSGNVEARIFAVAGAGRVAHVALRGDDEMAIRRIRRHRVLALRIQQQLDAIAGLYQGYENLFGESIASRASRIGTTPAALIHAALRNGMSQHWMYEALSIAMRA